MAQKTYSLFEQVRRGRRTTYRRISGEAYPKPEAIVKYRREVLDYVTRNASRPLYVRPVTRAKPVKTA